MRRVRSVEIWRMRSRLAVGREVRVLVPWQGVVESMLGVEVGDIVRVLWWKEWRGEKRRGS